MTWMSDLNDMIAGPYDQAHLAAIVLYAGEMAMTLDRREASPAEHDDADTPPKSKNADKQKRYRERLRDRNGETGVTSHRDATVTDDVTDDVTVAGNGRNVLRRASRAVTTKDLSSKAVVVGTGSSESLSVARANDRNSDVGYADRNEDRNALRVTHRDGARVSPPVTEPASLPRAQQVAPLQQQTDYRDRAAGADVQARLDAMDAEQSGVEPINRAMQLSVALGAEVSDKLRAYFKRHSVSINLQRAYVDTIAGALKEPGVLPIDVAKACEDDETNPVVKGAFGFRRFVVTAAATRAADAARDVAATPSGAISAHRAGFITARAAHRDWGEAWTKHCAVMAHAEGMPTWLHWADQHFDDPWPPEAPP